MRLDGRSVSDCAAVHEVIFENNMAARGVTDRRSGFYYKN